MPALGRDRGADVARAILTTDTRPKEVLVEAAVGGRVVRTYALRVPLDTEAVQASLRGRPAQWQAEAPKYDPVVVTKGAVLENVQKEPDVLAFPSPFWHEMDGGFAGRQPLTAEQALQMGMDDVLGWLDEKVDEDADDDGY